MRTLFFSIVLAGMAAACGDSAIDELRSLAERDAPCTTAADCCVVFEPCHAAAYVVGEADFSRAKKLASEVDDSECVRCASRPVEVECVEGGCTGREVWFEEASEGHSRSHCGPVEPQAEEERPPAGALAPATDLGSGRVLGCGS